LTESPCHGICRDIFLAGDGNPFVRVADISPVRGIAFDKGTSRGGYQPPAYVGFPTRQAEDSALNDAAVCLCEAAVALPARAFGARVRAFSVA